MSSSPLIFMKYLILCSLAIFGITFSAWFPMQGTNIWYVQYFFMFGFLCLGVSLKLWEWNKYVSIFSIICLFSCLVVCEHGSRATYILLQLYLSFLAVYTISQMKSSYRSVLLKCLFALFILQAVYVIVQFFGKDPMFYYVRSDGAIFEGVDDTVGFSGSHNQIGLFFAVTAPLVIAFCPYLIPFSIFGLWNATTTAAFVGFMVGGFFYISKMCKYNVAAVVFITAISTLIFFTKFENINQSVIKERLVLWENTIKQVNKGKAYVEREEGIIKVVYNSLIIDYEAFSFGILPFKKEYNITPYFGYGLSNWITVSPFSQYGFLHQDLDWNINPRTTLHVYEHAHNDLIEVFFELGWIGLVSVLLILGDFVRRFKKAKKTKILMICAAGMLAHLVTSMGIYTVHTAMGGMLLIILWGCAEGEMRDVEGS